MGNEEKLLSLFGYKEEDINWDINADKIVKDYLNSLLDIKQKAGIPIEAELQDSFNGSDLLSYMLKNERCYTYYCLEYEHLKGILTEQEKQNLKEITRKEMLREIKENISRSYSRNTDGELMVDYAKIYGLRDEEITEIKKVELLEPQAYFELVGYVTKEEDKAKLMELAKDKIEDETGKVKHRVFNYFDGTWNLTRYTYLTSAVDDYLKAIEKKYRYDLINRCMKEPKEYLNCIEFNELKDKLLNIKQYVKNEARFYKELISDMTRDRIEPKARDYLFDMLKANKVFNRILLKSLFSGNAEA